MIENFSTVQPQGAVILDIAAYRDTETKTTMYNSVLTFFLDEEGNTGMTIMTDIHSHTYSECIEETLRAASKMFSRIGADVTVFELNTHEVVCHLNLNELFPDGFDPDSNENQLSALERPKYLH